MHTLHTYLTKETYLFGFRCLLYTPDSALGSLADSALGGDEHLLEGMNIN